ncbi:MAG: hypothetical protein JSV52_06500 [Candidatus Zixiibacteriota bacterium]|nr:MAG: hypothetical protein JSV52_06500 [candidate division Zixibacteria bacterium]
MTRRIIYITLASGVIVITMPDHAHAYIDPSTGSYILQILLAGLLGALFTLKIFWRNIKGFLSRFLGKDRQHDVGAD